MNVFEAVKQSVTTRQAAEHYGIRVNRNGMACCPFHNDKTPSMKLDKRFHCFGCGADGDVIDFVAALYGLGKKEAAAQLASDFGLAYEDWKPPGRARKPKPRQKSPEEQFREAKAHCFRVLADYLHLLRVWKTDYAPHSPEEAFHPRFVEALQKQAHVEYLLDVLLFGETEEKAALITDYGKDVIQLEQRMAELAAADAARTKKHHPTKECLQFLYVTVIEVLQSVKDIDTVGFIPGTGKEFLRGYAEVITDAQKFVHRGHCLANRNTAHIAAAFAKVKAHFMFRNVEVMAQLRDALTDKILIFGYLEQADTPFPIYTIICKYCNINRGRAFSIDVSVFE